MKRGSKFLIVALSTFAMAGTAVAQGDGGDTGGTGDGTGDAGTGDGTATDGTGTGDAGTGDAGTGDAGAADAGAEGGPPPMILDKGKISIALAIQMSLVSDFIAKPLSIQPDIFYGVMPKLEVGVAHSSMGLQGWWGSFGGGLCLSGTDGGCGKVYNGPVGVIARYGLMGNEKMDIAADAGVIIAYLDPDVALGAKLGIKGRYMAGKIGIGFNPNIYVGFTQRDAGNKEYLSIPVDVHFMASPKLAVGVQTGIAGPLDGFGDAFRVPVSLGAMFHITPNISAAAAFNLLRVAGGDDGPGAADLRSITIMAMYHN